MGDAPSDNKPSGECKPVFLNSSNVFVYDQPSDMIGKFKVTVPHVKQGEDIVITSDGTVGNVKQTVTVTVTLKEVTTTVPIPPLDEVYGEDLDWYYNSGQARVDGKDGERGARVLVSPKMLKFEKSSPTYRADAIEFNTIIWPFKCPLTLNAGMLIFKTTIETNRNGNNDGRLILKVLPLAGVTRAGQTDKTKNGEE